jgi:hypothetical protein
MGGLSKPGAGLLAASCALGSVAACSDLLGITAFTPAGEDGGAPPPTDGSSSSESESGSEGGSGPDAGSDGGGDSGFDSGGDSGSDSGHDSGSDGGGLVITLRGYSTASDYGVAGIQTLSPTLDWTQWPGDLIVLLINYGASLSLSQVSDTSGNVYARFGTPVTNAEYSETMYYCFGAKAASAGANTVNVTQSAPGIVGGFSVNAFGFSAPGRNWVQDQYINDSQTDASIVLTGGVTTTYPDEVLLAGSGVHYHVDAGSGGSWIAEHEDGLGDLQEFMIVDSVQIYISATFVQSMAGVALSQLGTFAAKP